VDIVRRDWSVVDWIGVYQDKDNWGLVVNAMMTIRVPYNPGKVLSSYTTGSFSNSAQQHRVS
jgi:hypothetical protein